MSTPTIRSVQEYSRVVPPGNAVEFRAFGEFVFCKVADRPVRATISGQTVTLQAGDKVRFPGTFDNVQLENLDENPVFIQLVVGFGDYERLIVSGEVTSQDGIRRADGRFAPDTRYTVRPTIMVDASEQFSMTQGELLGEFPYDPQPDAVGPNSTGFFRANDAVFVLSDDPDGFVLQDGEKVDGDAQAFMVYSGKNGDFIQKIPTMGDSFDDDLDPDGPLVFINDAGTMLCAGFNGQQVIWRIDPPYTRESVTEIATEFHESWPESLQIKRGEWKERLSFNETRGTLFSFFEDDEGGYQFLETDLFGNYIAATELVMPEGFDRPRLNQQIITVQGELWVLMGSGGLAVYAYDPETYGYKGKRFDLPDGHPGGQGFRPYALEYLATNWNNRLDKYAAFTVDVKGAVKSVRCGINLKAAEFATIDADANAFENPDGTTVISGEVIKTALTAEAARVGATLTDDYMDHVFGLVLPGGRVISAGGETMKRAGIADSFVVTTPAELAITVDNDIWS